jgi:hypothetical protein
VRSIELAVQELERGFKKLKPLFPGVKFPQPAIVIQTKGRRKALGWFWRDKWANEDDEGIAEITIAAEHLKGSPEEIAETLVHEMVHYANHLDGIKDFTPNQYHNLHFKERAESVGLVVTKGPRGWAYTTAGPDLLEKIKKLRLNPEAFSLFRKTQEQAKAPTKMKKWSCGCSIVRAAVEVEATCHKCGQDFRRS